MRELRQSFGFTLVEMLLSTAIVALLMVVLASITNQTTATWRYISGKSEQFRGARTAFELMTNRLSQATLNTYWDYDDPLTPKRYERRSELRFLCGPVTARNGAGEELLGSQGGSGATRVGHCVFFHAPLGLTNPETTPTTQNPGYDGLENLLNTWGYFVEFGDDTARRPKFLTPSLVPLRYRFRLIEFSQPAEALPIYEHTSGWADNVAAGKRRPRSETYFSVSWYKAAANRPLIGAPGQTAPVHVLAENVIALILTPRLGRQEEEEFKKSGGLRSQADLSPLAANYHYDSTATNPDSRINPRNQLPPVVQVTMVAIDEPTAIRLYLNEDSADLFGLASAGSAGKFRATESFSRDLRLDSSQSTDRFSASLPLENQLVAMKATYRVFTTNVAIRAAKWSRQQVN